MMPKIQRSNDQKLHNFEPIHSTERNQLTFFSSNLTTNLSLSLPAIKVCWCNCLSGQTNLRNWYTTYTRTTVSWPLSSVRRVVAALRGGEVAAWGDARFRPCSSISDRQRATCYHRETLETKSPYRAPRHWWSSQRPASDLCNSIVHHTDSSLKHRRSVTMTTVTTRCCVANRSGINPPRTSHGYQ